MIAASLYITVCSARNRVRRWLSRLREPRYLIGAAAAFAYFYYAVFRRFGAGRSRGRGIPPGFLASLQPEGTALVGLWILVMAAGAWLFPFNSGLLDFSDAETEFLFPAPVTRRELLIHRLLRSQIGLALAGIIPALLIPFGSGFARLRFAVAIWLVMVAGKLYTTGVTLTRARGLRRAWVPVGLVAAVAAVVGASVWHAVGSQPYTGLGDLVDRLAAAVTTAPASIALLPLTTLARPVFADSPGAFLAALAGAAIVTGATLVWVLRADGALQDVADDVSARREQNAARASGIRTRAGAWTLGASGRPEMVFAWKAAVQSFRVADRRTIARLVALSVAVGAVALSLSRTRGPAAVVGLIGMGGAAYVVILGPQILRIDLRQDLLQLEWLKTWPLRPAELVRGEILWPGALLTALAWALLGVGFAMSGAALPSAGLRLRASFAAGTAALVPALVFAQLTIHNAAALAFPGWISLGRQRPRGFDAIGQRLITLGGTWLALLVALLPGAVGGGIVWLASSRLVGGLVAMVPAAAAATAVTAIEVALATEALGPLFEKLDLTSVEESG